MNAKVPFVLALGLVVVLAGVAVLMTANAQGTLVVLVKDTPSDFSHVIVTFDQVAVHPANANNSSEWLTVNITNGQVDFIALGNLTQQLGLQKLPAGKYTQIRILVKTVTATLPGGVSVDMVVPSHELKTTTPFNLSAGGVTTITVDFDLAHSIHQAGNTWYFTPVIGSVDVS